jgi:hypothetical protein
VNRNILSFDTDWCPDWAIEEIANLLIKKKIKSSWFVTNDFPLLKELEKNSLFDIGIHPNFFPGSSHGNDIQSVIRFFKEFVPEARIVRSHSLYSSERHLQILANEFDMTHDSSIYVHGTPVVYPHKLKYSEEGKVITRVPHFFQDNMYIINKSGSFCLKEPFFLVKGLRVFNFHPIHYILNTESMNRYNMLKSLHPRLEGVSKAVISKLRNNGIGIGTLLTELINELSVGESFKISEVDSL